VNTINNSSSAFKIFDNFDDTFICGYNKSYEKEGVSGLLIFDVSLKNGKDTKNLEYSMPFNFSEKMVPENKIDSDLFDELYAIPGDDGATVAYCGGR
jgi:hypothetical protein